MADFEKMDNIEKSRVAFEALAKFTAVNKRMPGKYSK
jgi:hypothetical protein